MVKGCRFTIKCKDNRVVARKRQIFWQDSIYQYQWRGQGVLEWRKVASGSVWGGVCHQLSESRVLFETNWHSDLPNLQIRYQLSDLINLSLCAMHVLW